MSNYRQNKITKTPKVWEMVKLENEIILEYGKGLTEKKREAGSYPVYGSNGIVGYHNNFLIKGPGIIVGRKGTIGAICWSNDNFWPIDTTYYVKIVNRNRVSFKWLYYRLIALRLSRLNMATGTPGLNRNLVYSLSIPLPTLPEQQKIAEILGTVDEAIAKVDKAIKRTQRLKKGLMQELLTRGIGHKEFKDTKVGKIPRDWTVRKLEEIVEINKESIEPMKEFPNQKFVYIDIDSIENETGVINKPKEILGKNAPSRARRLVHSNDIIMSTVRPYLKAFAMVPTEYENQICSTGFVVLTCKNNLYPVFLLYTLFSKIVIDQCNRMMVGGQYPALNNSQVAKIKFPLPPLTEQKEIVEILSSIDKKLELLRKRKEKFERIKKGLMNDLLTGKKRVRI